MKISLANFWPTKYKNIAQNKEKQKTTFCKNPLFKPFSKSNKIVLSGS